MCHGWVGRARLVVGGGGWGLWCPPGQWARGLDKSFGVAFGLVVAEVASGPDSGARVDLVTLSMEFELGILYGLCGWWWGRHRCELSLFSVRVATAVGFNCGDSPRSERGVGASLFVLRD